MATGFRLDKWYFDCASPEGDVAILYRADLRYRALTVAYASCLTYADATGVTTASSLRTSPEPQTDGENIRCSLPALRVEGSWRGRADSIEREILASPRGSLTWACVNPAAEAEVAIGNAPAIRGLGYVERLALTLSPWALPIDELRWGRFIGGGKSIVWIEWRGPSPFQMILEDGRLAHEGSIADDRVTIPARGLELRLSDFRVLRQGDIGKTALSILPKSMRDAFPGRIFGLRERKWRSRGELRRAGVVEAEGWVIHEVVQWP